MTGPRRNVRVTARLDVTANGDRVIDATTWMQGFPLWNDRGPITFRTRDGEFIELPSPLTSVS